MMDTPHTGSNDRELLSITSSKVAIIIKGKANHPNSNFCIDQKLSSIKVYSADNNFDVCICGEKTKNNAEINHYYSGSIIPIFFEQRDYEINIEYKKGDVVQFWHENINIRDKISETGKFYPRLSGMVNFGNEIGYSDLYILVNGKEHIKLTIEIFPTKLDYQNDYQMLLQDVTNEVYNLAFDFLKKTYQQAGIIQKCGNSGSEFFSIINIIFDRMLAAADTVILHPHHELQSYSEIIPAHKVKRVDTKTIKWINAHAQSVKRDDYGKLRTGRILTTKKQASFDTLENRFVKFVLASTIKKLDSLKQNYYKTTMNSRKRDTDVTARIERMAKELKKRADFTFLKEIGQFNSNKSMSLVFAMAPGYKELYRYYLILQKGLSIHGSIFNISVKDMANLYEYWCFIKLNSILKEKYRLVRQDILKTDKSGLFVTLKKGQKSSVEYENPINGEHIYLAYNQGYKANEFGIPTVAQRPDNVLSLSKNESKGKYEYIFDAKYKINMAVQGSDYYNRISHFPGPEEDDINTMHRYRDAIVYQNSKNKAFERTMFGAYVLFPYNNEEEYINHRFCKSIETVNIGGLPFLPGSTDIVERFLDELIVDSSDSAFERAILPKGVEEKLEHVDLKVRDVMVGMVRDREQFDICIGKHFYYIPENLVAESRFPIRYIALYQSQKLFGNDSGISYYGEVKRCKRVKRSEIIEVPNTKRKNPDELYYYFEVVNWCKLESAIELSGIIRTVNYYTNFKLLQCCKTSSELLFTSLEQLRLYSELKRLSNDAKIREGEDNVKGFEFNGSYIFVSGDEIHVQTYDGRQKKYLISYFTRRTKTVFNEISDAVDCE